MADIELRMTPQQAIKRINEHNKIHFEKEKGRCPLITEALKMAVTALEKEIPKKPIITTNDKEVPTTHRLGRLLVYHCPTCRHRLFTRHETDTVKRGFSLALDFYYCRNCGQRVDIDEFKRFDDEIELE